MNACYWACVPALSAWTGRSCRSGHVGCIPGESVFALDNCRESSILLDIGAGIEVLREPILWWALRGCLRHLCRQTGVY